MATDEEARVPQPPGHLGLAAEAHRDQRAADHQVALRPPAHEHGLGHAPHRATPESQQAGQGNRGSRQERQCGAQPLREAGHLPYLLTGHAPVDLVSRGAPLRHHARLEPGQHQADPRQSLSCSAPPIAPTAEYVAK
jgi:hypothetical protein